MKFILNSPILAVLVAIASTPVAEAGGMRANPRVGETPRNKKQMERPREKQNPRVGETPRNKKQMERPREKQMVAHASKGKEMHKTRSGPVLDLVSAEGDVEYFFFERCEGSCAYDSDCALGLMCYYDYDDGNGTEVPGCSGMASAEHHYCIDPLHSNSLVIMGDEGHPIENYPLGECQGDCDYDSDCEGDLFCRQRDEFDTIAGCVGSGDWGWDYCTAGHDYGECTNMEGWIDYCDDNCDWYEANEEPGCPEWGDIYGTLFGSDNSTVANLVPVKEACCHCNA